ncbi:MAG: Rrf2 family transcriptional regulator [Lentisphaerae bacterium]|nr:Rrf2 family transcriptional regulator [Lentisphaerota bacterium]
MAGLLKISEATTLALHALLLLAYGAPRQFSARALAETMKVSEAHLAKVLQRLAKSGFVRSSRGPGGGFLLTAPATGQPLLKVCEAIEGPLTPQTCLLPHSLCGGTACCALEGLIQRVNREVYDYLTGTTLANVMTGRQRRKAHAPKHRHH